MDKLWQQLDGLQQRAAHTRSTDETAPVLALVDDTLALMAALMSYVENYCTNRED